MKSCRLSRPPCGGADRNNTRLFTHRRVPGRPPCGGADRNTYTPFKFSVTYVAPRAGARIETMCSSWRSSACRRPPCGGADRNRLWRDRSRNLNRRPPCGGADRNIDKTARPALAHVAPRAGARIETLQGDGHIHRPQSPPVRGRGSKLPAAYPVRPRSASPPVRGRGSKRCHTATIRHRKTSPPVRGRGSKRVDRGLRCLHLCRPPCGGADRNSSWRILSRETDVAPRAGARIETDENRPSEPSDPSRPPCGGADRNNLLVDMPGLAWCRPPCGGADRNNGHGHQRLANLLSPPVRGRGSKQAWR